MLISLLLIALITIGGMSLTYLISKEKPLMWRLAAGNIVGSAVFGTLLLVVTSLAGLSVAIAAVSLLVTLAPVALLTRSEIRRSLKNEWQQAKGKLQGFGNKRLRAFLYYAFFFFLFWFFFRQAMYEMPDGIFTGGSQNLGDLPFHLGAISSFTDGANFPPQNPSFAGTKFSYPFIADLITAAFVKFGADVANAISLQDLSWAMSLLVILERFAAKLTGNKLAGRIAPTLLFFTGGLGFLWFLKDYWQSGVDLWNFLWHLPRDYTISNDFRWGNSLVVLFITQRSLLLGMPLTILVLHGLWKIFATESTEDTEKAKGSWTTPLLLGLLAGTLPLIHLHSLFAVFVVTGCLLLIRPAKWRAWLIFGVGICMIAVPELVWSIVGSGSSASKFFGFNWGWDKGNEDYFIWFWLKNAGLTLPAIIAAIWLLLRRKGESKNSQLLLFYIPFALLFVICNVMKLAPWEWDNIKIIIYWFVGSTPLIAYAIVWLWERKMTFKIVAALCFVVLIFSGYLDVWRTSTGQIKTKVIERDGVTLAEQLKQKTDPHALFLNAPTYNSPVLLSGRLSLMRYSGHLGSYGIDYQPREDDVRKIYLGGGVAEVLLRKYNIDDVLIGPEERDKLEANETYFQKFPLVTQSGQYRVYKVK